MKKIFLFTTAACLAGSALAGGYRVSTQGQRALAMGHAGVAMSDSAEVVFFNPAGMTQLQEQEQLTGGITFLSSDTIYQNDQTSASTEMDNPLATPFNFYYSSHQDGVALGLGIYTPYGNSVEWPTDWAGSHLVNNIDLKAIYIQPTVAFDVSEQFSIGLGAAYAIGSVTFNRNLNTSLVNGSGERSNVTVKADDVNAWGYNLGFMFKATESLTLGLSYRSQIDLKARDQEADFHSIPQLLSTVYPDTRFDSDLVLPAELTLGLALSLSPETTLAVDINRGYWSAYDSLDLTFDNGAGASTNPRNWQDSNIYRIGVQHQLNDNWTLRGGYYYDETPIPDGYFAPETPRGDAQGFTAGASVRLDKNLQLDMSFLYISSGEFDGSYDHYDQYGSDVSFGGRYETTATSIGLGINYTF